MANTNRPRKRMDKYFKNLERDAYILSYNKKGSCTTKIKKWSVVRRLTKNIISDEEHAGRNLKDSKHLEPGVQLLPRKDVMLYGTIPALEQRVYSKCNNCSKVFNPRDVISHRDCSDHRHLPQSHMIIKKKVKSSKKRPEDNYNSYSTNSNSNNVSSGSPSSKDFEFKRPYTPPPMITSFLRGNSNSISPTKEIPSSMPQLKVAVTKIGLSKPPKSSTVKTSTHTSTTSTEKSDSKLSPSKVSSSVHHSSKSSSGHHSSKSSSGHSPRSPTGHHSSRSSSSSHHSPRSPSSSHHTTKSSHYSPRSPSKGSSHHGNGHNSHSHISKPSTKAMPMDTLPPSSSSSSSHHHHGTSSSSHSSSKHKKSSSSSSKRSTSSSSPTSSKNSIHKNYDPDIHCGVMDGSRGPCMRSITCSNHRLQHRKQVSGRSKDIRQLITEKKASKENDTKQASCSYTSPNGEAKETPNANTTYVPVAGKIVSTSISTPGVNSFVHIVPKVSSTHQTRLQTTSILAKANLSKESETVSTRALTNGYLTRAKNIENTQENIIGTVPVVIMPVMISPISVVSSVQLLKIGNNIMSLESPQSASNPPARKQTIIPVSSTNGIKTYKSHPKPIVLPNFGARKLGGAVLLGNPLLEDQRNDLLTTIDFELETVNIERGLSGLNHSNSTHRPNILKGKGGIKVSCKRPATDKLITTDCKRLVSDVNGFILHADVTETMDSTHFSGDNEITQHESIIRLINQHGF
ncbi:hypothetical protein ABEB36_011286 [Hypothenemus hampei]|uniref:SCA7 domain-containing protein n=1 Tax=Hypothenemus hampei TaxID=57062 RepID=A0ABD1EFF7_HYPHA